MCDAPDPPAPTPAPVKTTNADKQKIYAEKPRELHQSRGGSEGSTFLRKRKGRNTSFSTDGLGASEGNSAGKQLLGD